MRYLVGFVLAVALGPAPVAAEERPVATPDAAKERQPEARPDVVDPSLSPLRIRRWHPEAYELPVTSEREREVQYISSEGSREQGSAARKYRNRAIVGGVFAGIGLAITAGGVAALSSYNRDPEPDVWVPVGPYTVISLGVVTTLAGTIGAAVAGGKARECKTGFIVCP